MKDVVIGDIHARQEACRTLLEKIGIITINSGDPMTDVRNDGFRIHQLGDAVSLGYGELESNFLTWWDHVSAPEDVWLIGNHELPVMWHDRSMDFSGIEDHDPLAWQMVLDFMKDGRYRAASSVGEWLLTHAGLDNWFQRDYNFTMNSASEVAEMLDNMLVDTIEERTPAQRRHPIAGMMHGIFWSRDVPEEYNDSLFKQMFGHTPVGPIRYHGGMLWNLDTCPTQMFYEKKRSGHPVGRSDYGSCAAMVFDTPESGPRLVLPYEEVT